jgi:hypothetical protein
LEILSDSAWLELGSTSIFSAIIPIVIGGGLAHFKVWLPAEDDVRKRVELRKQVLREGVTKLFQAVLTKAMECIVVKDLRGSPPKETDILSDHTCELFRVFAVFVELEQIQRGIRWVYTYLFFSAAFGILELLVAVPLEKTRPWIAVLSYVVIISQVYAVGFLRRCAKRLEEYEKTT